MLREKPLLRAKPLLQMLSFASTGIRDSGNRSPALYFRHLGPHSHFGFGAARPALDGLLADVSGDSRDGVLTLYVVGSLVVFPLFVIEFSL